MRRHALELTATRRNMQSVGPCTAPEAVNLSQWLRLPREIPKVPKRCGYFAKLPRLPSVQNVFCCLLWCLVGIVQPKADPWCCLHFTKYKFNVYRKKYIRSGRDSAVVGIVGKSKSLDFPTMLIFWSLVRNSVVLAVYLLFSVACFLTVHEHWPRGYHRRSPPSS